MTPGHDLVKVVVTTSDKYVAVTVRGKGSVLGDETGSAAVTQVMVPSFAQGNVPFQL